MLYKIIRRLSFGQVYFKTINNIECNANKIIKTNIYFYITEQLRKEYVLTLIMLGSHF